MKITINSLVSWIRTFISRALQILQWTRRCKNKNYLNICPKEDEKSKCRQMQTKGEKTFGYFLSMLLECVSMNLFIIRKTNKNEKKERLWKEHVPKLYRYRLHQKPLFWCLTASKHFLCISVFDVEPIVCGQWQLYRKLTINLMALNMRLENVDQVLVNSISLAVYDSVLSMFSCCCFCRIFVNNAMRHRIENVRIESKMLLNRHNIVTVYH